MISRKFNDKLSLQFSPTFFHDNYVVNDLQDNSQYGLIFGGRYKLGKRWSFNLEYGAHLNRDKNSLYNNPLSIGFDLETGGHVFQLHFTNSQFMNANGVLGNSTGDWSDGDFSLSEYKEYDFILMQMIEAGQLDLNQDGEVNRKDLKHAMDQITDAMAGSDLATVKNTVQLPCKHFMD